MLKLRRTVTTLSVLLLISSLAPLAPTASAASAGGVAFGDPIALSGTTHGEPGVRVQRNDLAGGDTSGDRAWVHAFESGWRSDDGGRNWTGEIGTSLALSGDSDMAWGYPGGPNPDRIYKTELNQLVCEQFFWDDDGSGGAAVNDWMRDDTNCGIPVHDRQWLQTGPAVLPDGSILPGAEHLYMIANQIPAGGFLARSTQVAPGQPPHFDFTTPFQAIASDGILWCTRGFFDVDQEDGSLHIVDCLENGDLRVYSSYDGGITWVEEEVAGHRNSTNLFPVISVDDEGGLHVSSSQANGNLLYSYRPEDGAWTDPVTIVAGEGTASNLALKTTALAWVDAGEGGKANIVYLGTTAGPDPDHIAPPNQWHLWMSQTLDGGQTWSHAQADQHAVQTGCISTAGLPIAGPPDCPNRNLVDFIAADHLSDGRAVISYTYGCPSSTGCDGVVGQSNGAETRVVVQDSGSTIRGDDVVPPDTDADGIPDVVDNCDGVANPGQEDADRDGLGDVCDPAPFDGDNDGVVDDTDNCPSVANAGQKDADGDGVGDACDVDAVQQTLYMDGVDQFGEVDQVVSGTYLRLDPSVGASEKSMVVPNYTGGPNDACAGNNLYPVFVGDVKGRVVGDLKISFPTLASHGNVDIRVWPDVTTQRCNEDYPEPAGSVQVALPLGEGSVDATISDLDFIAEENVMIQITPVILEPPYYARVFYGTPASKVSFDLAAAPDADGDGITDTKDNCPEASNPGQEDADDDGIGDACDVDRDGDGVADDSDNCPDVSNAGQGDADSDDTGDSCDGDRDGDAVANETDNCPDLSNADQKDDNSNDVGDACESADTSTTYYFHSLSGIGNYDLFLTGGHPFDTEPPTRAEFSQYQDLPAGNGAPNALYDPNWVGTIDQKITGIELDFWAKTPVGDFLGQVDYNPIIWVGSTAYNLPTLTAEIDPQIGNVPTRLTKKYTTMLDANDNEVPLSIDPAGQPITISIGGTYIVDEAGSYIVYDSIDYPSAFTVYGSGTGPVDSDGDGKPDSTDNCPDVANPEQTDSDNDGTGAACDVPENTTLAFTADTTQAGQHSDNATIGARLADASGDAIEGAELVFQLVGAETRSWTAVTGTDGVATTTEVLSEAPGEYELTVHYAGKAEVYELSSDNGGVFSVWQEDSASALEAGAPSGKGKQSSRTLTATITDPDGSSLVAGRVLSFFSDGELMGTATTNEQGVAIFNTPHNYAYGHRVYRADFDGDTYYTGSSASKTG